MRKLGTFALASALVVTATLSSACHVGGDGDTGPSAPDFDVAEQADAPTGTRRTTAPSPTSSLGADRTPTTSEATGAAESSDQPESQGTENDNGPVGPRDSVHDSNEADATEPDRLPPVLESALRASLPESEWMLHAVAAQGDLNGDGIEDVVVHAQPRSEDSPKPHLLVPVAVPDAVAGAGIEVLPAVEIGRRIILDAIAIHEGRIEVSLFDRAPSEPLTQVTRRTTLSINPESADGAQPESEWAATVTRVEPIDKMPSLQITRPQTRLAFGLDDLAAAVSDRIELRQQHRYVVHAAENAVLVATLAAPVGVWLSVHHADGDVLVPVAEQTQRLAARVPAAGEWTVTVASSLVAPADYRLAVELFPPEFANHIDTRDPGGFWSNTAISPPALPDEGPVVYLTFDDGPHPVYTPQVLDVLARHGAHATFFVLGYLAERYPSLIQRIAHEGHTLANHSWDHQSLAHISQSAFERSVGRTQEVLGPLATGCLRPPYWNRDRNTEGWAAELGMRLVGWSYSPRDWEQPSAKTIANGIVARSTPGAVLLLHDGGGPRSATVRGLDMALERLSGRGLEFKPLCRY